MRIGVKRSSVWILLFMMLWSCDSDKVILPKPRSYPKITYPEKRDFQDFDKDYCDFGFRFPVYAEIEKDEFFFEEKPMHPCWFDVSTPTFNATLHCSYYPIDGRKSLDDLVNDAYRLAGKHNLKAEYYEESVLNYPGRVKGVLFEIEGDVATPVQFFLTDSSNHFFRASLYFNSEVNPDSIAPILDFVKADIDTLLSSFTWN